MLFEANKPIGFSTVNALSLIGSYENLFSRVLTPAAKRSSPARMSATLPCRFASTTFCFSAVDDRAFVSIDSRQSADGGVVRKIGRPVVQRAS